VQYSETWRSDEPLAVSLPLHDRSRGHDITADRHRRQEMTSSPHQRPLQQRHRQTDASLQQTTHALSTSLSPLPMPDVIRESFVNAASRVPTFPAAQPLPQHVLPYSTSYLPILLHLVLCVPINGAPLVPLQEIIFYLVTTRQKYFLQWYVPAGLRTNQRSATIVTILCITRRSIYLLLLQCRRREMRITFRTCS